MKKTKSEILFDALTTLYREACEFEQDDTAKLSRALNKAKRAINKTVEMP